jgi:hypothetical protein
LNLPILSDGPRRNGTIGSTVQPHLQLSLLHAAPPKGQAMNFQTPWPQAQLKICTQTTNESLKSDAQGEATILPMLEVT